MRHNFKTVWRSDFSVMACSSINRENMKMHKVTIAMSAWYECVPAFLSTSWLVCNCHLVASYKLKPFISLVKRDSYSLGVKDFFFFGTSYCFSAVFHHSKVMHSPLPQPAAQNYSSFRCQVGYSEVISEVIHHLPTSLSSFQSDYKGRGKVQPKIFDFQL